MAKIKRLGYGLYYIGNGEVTKNLRKWSRGVMGVPELYGEL